MSVTLHIVDLWQFYVCCTRSGVTRCTPSLRFSSCAVCAGSGYTRCCDRTSVYLCASSLQNLSVSPDIPGQCLYRTILVTPCSMVWDWRVSRAGPMPFYWPSCSFTFCLMLFSLSLLSLWVIVLGLRSSHSKSKSKSYDLLRTEIYIEHKIFYQLKHDQN